VHKDTHWDLARIKRWRWRDKPGIKALTGSPAFTPRMFPHVVHDSSAGGHRKKVWARDAADRADAPQQQVEEEARPV
jgi:hypothetical protein